jgi:hypothetical protein
MEPAKDCNLGRKESAIKEDSVEVMTSGGGYWVCSEAEADVARRGTTCAGPMSTKRPVLPLTVEIPMAASLRSHYFLFPSPQFFHSLAS